MNAEFKALVGVLAVTLGKKQSELLAELKSGEDDTFKAASEIKSYLSPLLKAKFEGLVPVEKVEQARGKALKDAYDDIEDKIETKFGVVGKLKDGLLDQVSESLKEDTEVDPEDYKNSAVHKQFVKDHKAEIQALKKTHLSDLQAEKASRVDDKLFETTLAYLQDPKNKFELPSKESILIKQVRNLVSEIKEYKYEDKPISLSIGADKSIVLRDADDMPLKDKALNDISIFTLVKNVASEGYFTLKEASGRETPGSDEADKTKVKVEFGKDKKVIETPSFKTRTEMNAYLTGDGAELGAAERHAIREAHSEAFDKTE